MIGNITGQGAWMAAWLIVYPVLFLVIGRSAINGMMDGAQNRFMQERSAYAGEQARLIAAQANVAWFFRTYDSAIPMWGRAGFLYL